MKKFVGSGVVFLVVMGIMVHGVWAQQKAAPDAKVMVPAPTPTKVTSCIKQVTIPVKFDDAFLKSNVDNTAMTVNINNVPLTIAGSNLSGDMVSCFYKSQNGDIPNLVYKYPCKNGKKGGTSYEHSYTCDK
jgi:hypothetical protein